MGPGFGGISPARAVADRMAGAARDWLDSLTPAQREPGTGAVPADDASDAERRRWFYTPTDHGGLTVHQQRPAQQRAAMRLVATGLSTPGYVTVATTMGLENVLDHTEGFVARFDRERGRDPGLYYLRVFGEPGGPAPWGWRFGGHHVSLNNLVVDGTLVATTPCFMGADPAASPLLGGALLVHRQAAVVGRRVEPAPALGVRGVVRRYGAGGHRALVRIQRVEPGARRLGHAVGDRTGRGDAVDDRTHRSTVAALAFTRNRNRQFPGSTPALHGQQGVVIPDGIVPSLSALNSAPEATMLLPQNRP